MTKETQTQSSLKSWGFLALKSLLGVVLLAVIAFFVGPTNEFGSDTPSSRSAPTQTLSELDEWLAQSEAKFSDINLNRAISQWKQVKGQGVVGKKILTLRLM